MVDSYEQLKRKKVDVAELIEWHFKKIIEATIRRISPRQSFRNPWLINIQREINSVVFFEAFKAIKHYHIEFGRTISLTKDRKQRIKEISITFVHSGALRFHLGKLAQKDRKDIEKEFTKTFKGGSKGTIVVSNEKPAVLTYNVSHHLLKVIIHYQVTNKYGNVCSF